MQSHRALCCFSHSSRAADSVSDSACATQALLDAPPCASAEARAGWQRLVTRAKELVALLRLMPEPVARMYIAIYTEQLAQHTMAAADVPKFIDACLAA